MTDAMRKERQLAERLDKMRGAEQALLQIEQALLQLAKASQQAAKATAEAAEVLVGFQEAQGDQVDQECR